MVELVWDGKYDTNGRRVAPLRIALPFQTVEAVNETAQERQRQLDLFHTGRDQEWRNRLIWGDKKYVLPSLLPEFAGKVDLIYIDPPFDTGADFSFQAKVPDNPETVEDESIEFAKAPSMLELKAYRDTWGRGQESYLQWFYATAIILRELLSDRGSIYVHLDYRAVHEAKVILDEVFGKQNIVSEIIWYYSNKYGANSDAFDVFHNTLLLYAKTRTDFTYHPVRVPVKVPRKQPVRQWNKDLGKNEWQRDSSGNYLYRDSEDKEVGDVWEIPVINPVANERVGYATQKPEALLTRVINASSNSNDLVLDCFCGSGTTAVVAEKLGRRWIAADLGRFAIHVTRKRLLSVPDVRPFVVQNLGKYERQAWHAAEFGERAEETQRSYRRFVLDLYHAEPADAYHWLHGMKAGRWVHVGAVDSPVVEGDLKGIANELRASGGSRVDILGWDFAFNTNEDGKDLMRHAGIDARFLKIPREVLEKRAVEQGDIAFFELGALGIETACAGQNITVTLADFVIPLDDLPEDVRRHITHWSQMLDYWAVDWEYKGDAFHNEWQSYRTRKDPKLSLVASHTYEEPGTYQVMVKAIDILGNDTTKVIEVSVGTQPRGSRLAAERAGAG